MFTEIRLVSPEQAEEWLEYNQGNRSPSSKSVNAIADDIVNGRWKETHQGIAFTGDAQDPRRLLDGQKRLMAIIKADKAIRIGVTWEVSPDSFIAIDTDRKFDFSFNH